MQNPDSSSPLSEPKRILFFHYFSFALEPFYPYQSYMRKACRIFGRVNIFNGSLNIFQELSTQTRKVI
jgi:hypothetical protein